MNIVQVWKEKSDRTMKGRKIKASKEVRSETILCDFFFRAEHLTPFSGPAVVVGVTMYVLSISALSEVEMVY